MSNPKQKVEDLFAKYNDGSGYIRVVRDGTDYVVTMVGSYDNRGRYKVKRYDENGILLFDGVNPGTDGKYLLTAQIAPAYKNLYSVPLSPTGIDNSPIVNPPTQNDPGNGPITNEFNTSTGYGEIDLRAALEEITGQALPEVNDDVNNAGKVQLDTGAYIDDPTITRSGAIEAHQAGFRGQGIVVAVIDTGIANHTDIDANLWTNPGEIPNNGIDDDGNGYIDDIHGWNTTDDNNDISDIQGHGTFVAGVIAAEDNGIGRLGVAPDVKIMVLKPFRRNPFTGEVGAPLEDTNEAIRYAVDNGADIINLSLGSSSELITEGRLNALQYAEDNGVICVYASGNDSLDRPGSPAVAAADIGIAVGAADDVGNIAPFSNLAGGERDVLGDGLANPLYVTANGTTVYSPDWLDLDGVTVKDGTSFSCPVVAGAIAVMLSAQPTLTPDQIKVILANTSRDSFGEERGS